MIRKVAREEPAEMKTEMPPFCRYGIVDEGDRKKDRPEDDEPFQGEDGGEKDGAAGELCRKYDGKEPCPEGDHAD